MLTWNFSVVQQVTFYPHQDYERVNSTNKSHFYTIGWSIRDGKVITVLQLARLKTGTFKPKFDKIYFLYQYSQPLYDVLGKDLKVSSLFNE